MGCRSFTVLIAGVGGLGVMLLSRILANAVTASFRFVCRTELRGLSQRGGPVSSAVRFGDYSLTPTLATGLENLVVSLDALETLRLLPTTNAEATVLTNSQFLSPSHCGELDERLSDLRKAVKVKLKSSDRYICLDLNRLASDANCPTCQNIVMLGVASNFLPIPADVIVSHAIDLTRNQNPDTIRRAFNAGFASGYRPMTAVGTREQIQVGKESEQ